MGKIWPDQRGKLENLPLVTSLSSKLKSLKSQNVQHWSIFQKSMSKVLNLRTIPVTIGCKLIQTIDCMLKIASSLRFLFWTNNTFMFVNILIIQFVSDLNLVHKHWLKSFSKWIKVTKRVQGMSYLPNVLL